MTRLLKADLHGILDGLEEPEEVVKQTIRDMEEALAQKAQTLTTLQATLQRLSAEETALAHTAQEIETHIDSCFQAGNETLARSFIRKRLETARQASRSALWQRRAAVCRCSRLWRSSGPACRQAAAARVCRNAAATGGRSCLHMPGEAGR
jgi:phage shock protein A